MALKPDRNITEDDITYTCDVAAERGLGLVKKTSGSGVVIGDSANAATWVANPSGYKFVGILMNDVVNVDQTKYHLNFHKNEVQVGERVWVLRKGRVTTNAITGTPDHGDVAYLSSSGTFTPTLHATGGLVATPKAGVFLGKKDADGYATIDINLPNY